MEWIACSIIGLVLIILLVISAQFQLEKERYALKQTLKLVLVFSFFVVLLLVFDIGLLWFAALWIGIGVILVGVFLYPISYEAIALKLDENKVDERTTIFSRMFELQKQSIHKTQFYKEYPQFEQIDNDMRAMPGLLSTKSQFYDKYYYTKAENYNNELVKLFPKITGPFNPDCTLDALGNIENEIHKVGKQLGAVAIGFTKLEDYHFYSKKGRGSRYNEPIRSNHEYAIAIAVEMDKDAVDHAPYAPVIAESCRQYLNGAKVAIGIAELLREKGYEATAHIDANYELICPLVARDAGLGDIGRMGLLMTPKLGPRVRLAVVSTTLTLTPSVKKYSNSIQYFCRICKKCAHACPSKAIQKNDVVCNGEVRYKINHEKCYSLWAKFGTDCARCMSVCPYSHPNNWFHNIVRMGINKNPIIARLALYADHYFYGKVPKIKHLRNL